MIIYNKSNQLVREAKLICTILLGLNCLNIGGRKKKERKKNIKFLGHQEFLLPINLLQISKILVVLNPFI